MSTQPNLITEYLPPAEFVAWKELPGAGLIMQAYYKYAAWDFRRFNLEGVPTSARFIEERVRDDIRVGKHQGVDLEGYSLNSHLTKPILMHMLAEHPEWRRMFEVRNKQESGDRSQESVGERPTCDSGILASQPAELILAEV